MAAILENNQTPEGRVRVPEVLQEMVGEEFL
jgi:seryl-tRNA synthetase